MTPSPHIAHVITGARRLGYAHGIARYFFDTRDNSHSLRDELGLELDSLELRDEIDFPVLRAALWFEVAVVAAL